MTLTCLFAGGSTYPNVHFKSFAHFLFFFNFEAFVFFLGNNYEDMKLCETDVIHSTLLS